MGKSGTPFFCIDCGDEIAPIGLLRCERCRRRQRGRALAGPLGVEVDHSHHLAVLAALQEEYDLEAVARHRRIEASLA